jgi:hypothetical protein
MTISKENIKKIKEFILSNDLDYDVIDNQISRFHINSYDGKTFFVYDNVTDIEEDFILVKYDPEIDELGDPTKQAYQYFKFENINKLLESLFNYDKELNKNYWEVIGTDIEMGVDKEKYREDWFDNIIDLDFETGELDYYKFISYEDESYKPLLKSPFNTLHEVSPLNPEPYYNKVNKLYFEIHPICCKEKEERYLLKILSNNDEIFKEFINYCVWGKKGLRLLVNEIFNNLK